MRRSGFAFVLLIFASTTLATFAQAATIVVNDATDTLHNPGCATTGTGACTLRDAITFANLNAGSAIHFNIAGGGVHTITPASALPAITAATTIDGYTQPGTSMNTATLQNGTNAVLLIEINLTTNAGGGLVVAGTNSVVQGLVLNNSTVGPGMTVSGDNVEVRGNFIGTNPAGTAAGPGNAGDGIAVSGQNDIIGGDIDDLRNLISANGGAGVRVSGGGSFAAVIGSNLIGTNAAGTAALGNGTQGVVLAGGSNHSVGVGFAVDQLGNVISGNGSEGVLATGGSGGYIIAGNIIGANAAGTAPIGNGGDGVTVNSSFTQVGGSNSNLQTNAIGASAGNGVKVSGSNNIVEGNAIGLLPNGNASANALAGVSVAPFANQNQIGTGSQGNVIANNTGNGVEVLGAGVTGGTQNSILSNRIFANGGLGIKLGNPPNTPTPNDVGDADTGPNTLQNFPVITAASIAGGLLSISGTLNSTASDDFQIDVFSSTTCDASGNGEGQTFLGTSNASSDGSGNATFGPVSLPIPGGQTFITVTATNSQLNTSEFSPCFTATGAPPLPTLSINNVSQNEGNSGTTAFTFTVTLSAASASTVTANFQTANGTATAGSDYTANSGVVTFAPGQTTRTITVSVTGDTTVEPDETFFVNLTAPVNATIATAQGTGTIVNDDVSAGPTITIGDVSQAEGDSGTTSFTFTLTLSSTANASVNFATADGSAAAGTDYVSSSGTVTFTSGGPLTQTITITVNGDTGVEGNETFFVNLSGASGATLLRSQAVGTIVNDDAAAPSTLPIPALTPAGTAALAVLLALAGGLAYRRMRRR
jgi:hypothetical protein